MRELTAFELPLLPPAVEELHVPVAEVPKKPVRVSREPVVVPAIQDDGGVVVDACRSQQPGESFLVDVLPPDLGVKVGIPVPGNRSRNVALRVRRGVFVDLDDAEVGLVEVLLEPIRFNQHVWPRVTGHQSPLSAAVRWCLDFRSIQ